MIVTLTANPSLDRTVTLAGPLAPGEVQAAVSAREDAGGKGINVARVAAAAGERAVAVLPLSPEDPFHTVLRATGIPARAVPVAGHVRSNIAITDPRGETTKLNLPGAELSAAERAALIEAVVTASAGARWLVLAGSVPPGAGDDLYVDVIAATRGRWGAHAPRIAVDTSGPALAAVVADAHPDLIKPNDDELAALLDDDAARDADPASLVAAARRFVPTRVGAALITLGSAGALLVTADGAWIGRPPPIRPVSTVGAGDSSLAGYLLADLDGADESTRLATAIRYGAAAASLPGTQAPTHADLPVDEIPISSLPEPASVPLTDH